jgi:hypothetical protein
MLVKASPLVWTPEIPSPWSQSQAITAALPASRSQALAARGTRKLRARTEAGPARADPASIEDAWSSVTGRHHADAA